MKCSVGKERDVYETLVGNLYWNSWPCLALKNRGGGMKSRILSRIIKDKGF
jgi:hypothetical protein